MKKGILFFIMGASGSGKGTLIENLKAQNSIKLDFLKSYSTRDIRPGEIDGNIYNFISKEKFLELISKEEFLEYKFVHNLNYYGTKKKDVVDGIYSGKVLIKEIEIEGLKDIYENHKELKPYIKTIFLDIGKKTLQKRIAERQGKMDETELKNRINSLEKERKEAKIYCDYIIDAEKNGKEKVFEKVITILGTYTL